MNQWTVITKIIDECDFYLLIVGGRYGSIDESVDISYTEKEYDYAKNKGKPVLVLIKNPSSITEDKKDKGYGKYDRYELMKRLDAFRTKVQTDGNRVAYFDNLNGLKYEASPKLQNAKEYADDNAGWVRYKDVADVINEEVEGRIKANAEFGDQKKKLEEMKEILVGFGSRLTDIESKQFTLGDIPVATKQDIENLFRVENETLIIGNGTRSDTSVIENDDVKSIPVDSAFLLVYAAEDNGQILKIQTLGSSTQVSAAGKRFMADEFRRESARWVEALERLVNWGWVKFVGYKGEIFKLTGNGYDKAKWLKNGMGIDTGKEPLEVLRKFGG